MHGPIPEQLHCNGGLTAGETDRLNKPLNGDVQISGYAFGLFFAALPRKILRPGGSAGGPSVKLGAPGAGAPSRSLLDGIHGGLTRQRMPSPPLHQVISVTVLIKSCSPTQYLTLCVCHNLQKYEPTALRLTVARTVKLPITGNCGCF